MKERSGSRDIKKRKSQDSFYLKAKLTPQHQLFKYPFGKKNAGKNNASMVELTNNPKDHRKRINSVQVSPADLSLAEGNRSDKNEVSKTRAIINNCLSDRNISGSRDQQKLFKYRKLSSNAQLEHEEPCSGVILKQKLSVVEGHKYFGPKDVSKSEQYNIMAWIVAIRKYFGKECKGKSSTSTLLNNLIGYLRKLHGTDLDALKLLIQRVSFEPLLTKEQLISVLEGFFKVPVTQLKINKKDKQNIMKVTFLEVLNCLVQYQLKAAQNTSGKNKDSNSQEHQEAVQTARFQEGNSSEQSKKCRKPSDILNPSKRTSIASMLQNQNINSLGDSQQRISISKDISPLFIRNKQSLNPSLSPFNILESKSITNSQSSLQPNDSQSAFFRKGSFQCSGFNESSLGMLTLDGKSPRQLMESQIYESMQQRFNVSRHRSNISFSLQNTQIQPHLPFEHTVHSFEQILTKIKTIQSNYIRKLSSRDLKLRQEDQPDEQINMFLQQLINYRMAMNDQDGEHYSYFVSWENMKQFKEHSHKLMLILLQSSYMKEYFFALEGLKIQNSPFLYSCIKPFFHTNLKILNINRNNISNINDVLAQLPDQNVLELLNISHNQFQNISCLLKKFSKLRELHASHNLVQALDDCDFEGERLKIIDFSHNQIRQESALVGVRNLRRLQILNLEGNPMLLDSEWKSKWKGSFNLNLIYEMDNLYVMSDFGHQKDIAFGKTKKQLKRRQIHKIKDKQQSLLSLHPSKQRQKPKLDEEQYMNHRKRSNKENSQQLLDHLLLRDEKEQPKQKISKIKTFLDGHII